MFNEFTWIKLNNQTLSLKDSHLFKIFLPEVNAEIFKIEGQLLSNEEKEKANRFRFPADRARFASARITLKLLLERFFQISIFEKDLEYTKLGKPFYKGLEFNISHSGNYLLIAISSTPIGIDLEITRENFDFEFLMDSAFSAEEVAYINREADRKTFFLGLWTRKESLLKATGEGIIEDLKSISVLNDCVYRNGKNYILNSFKVNQQDIASVTTCGATNVFKTYSIPATFYSRF